ncbi:MAG: hypothetical protein CVU09_15235 [Bacteroidetes bacterium HGW-Bacteroidetes-4]|jgi:FkbM family methyltransferase|nr:MAG: hypothetical protein CVU09_15235 [Bacteroidetes bacterium HGW-Bacteroidetes-4]
MINLKLYSLKEWIIILLNYVIFQIQKRIDYKIVQNKAINDEIIKAGFGIKKLRGEYLVIKKDFKAKIRKGTTDNLVFYQIFIEEEYKPIIDYSKENNFEIKTMLDLGANVGYSSLYFQMVNPTIKLCVVEPFESNVRAMKQNFSLNELQAKVIPGAVWYKECFLGINRDFRDGREWAISVAENAPVLSIKGYTIKQLMEINKFDPVDLLKIDIEGAEALLFDETISDVSFLEKVKIIAIEIHDELKCRENIYNILIREGFDIQNSGELTIGINGKK